THTVHAVDYRPYIFSPITTLFTVFLFSTHLLFYFFFFNDTATTEIYTLSLHDALPIYWDDLVKPGVQVITPNPKTSGGARWNYLDRKSTRLNSSHLVISYAVFCLKKKKTKK